MRKRLILFSICSCLVLLFLYYCKNNDIGLPFYKEYWFGVSTMYDDMLNKHISKVDSTFLKYNGICKNKGESDFESYEKKYSYVVPFQNSDKNKGYHVISGYWLYDIYIKTDTVKCVSLFLDGHSMEFAKDSVFFWIQRFSLDGYNYLSQEFATDTTLSWWDNYSISIKWNPNNDYSYYHEEWNKKERDGICMEEFLKIPRQYIFDSIQSNHDFCGEISAKNSLFEGHCSFGVECNLSDSENLTQWIVKIIVKPNS